MASPEWRVAVQEADAEDLALARRHIAEAHQPALADACQDEACIEGKDQHQGQGEGGGVWSGDNLVHEQHSSTKGQCDREAR